MQVTYRVEFGETLSVGGYQNIKPTLSETLEYLQQEYSKEEEETLRKEFREKVRQEYFELKKQMLDDFIGFASQVQKIYVPCKE